MLKYQTSNNTLEKTNTTHIIDISPYSINACAFLGPDKREICARWAADPYDGPNIFETAKNLKLETNNNDNAYNTVKGYCEYYKN